MRSMLRWSGTTGSVWRSCWAPSARRRAGVRIPDEGGVDPLPEEGFVGWGPARWGPARCPSVRSTGGSPSAWRSGSRSRGAGGVGRTTTGWRPTSEATAQAEAGGAAAGLRSASGPARARVVDRADWTAPTSPASAACSPAHRQDGRAHRGQAGDRRDAGGGVPTDRGRRGRHAARVDGHRAVGTTCS